MAYKKKSEDDVKKPKTEEQAVGLWHERLSIAKKEADDWAEKSGAKRFCDEYKGKFDISFKGRVKAIPVPPINEVFAYVQADIASTYNRDPYMTVNAKAGTTLGAKLWEVWLNCEWRELKIKEEMELELIDKDLVGFAFHKTGSAVDSVGTDEQLKIINEKLYSMRVDWRDVLWNLGSRRPPRDCQWMAQRIVRPLEDIKAKYPNARNLKGVCHPDMDEKTYQSSRYKDDIEVGIYYEIWDARGKQILLVAEGLKDKFLADSRPWPDYLDEFPFLMYWDFAIPGESRPMSAIAPWEAQILESMILLASAINHAKRWNRQMIISNGALDEGTLDRFEEGTDGSVLVNNGTGDVDKNVKVLDFGQLPTDFYLILDRLNAIKRDIHGQPEFDRGGVTKTNTRTIGELQLIKSGAKSRTDRKIDRMETHLENIARHMMAHMKANFDFEKAVKVTGDTPEEVIQALGDKYDPETGMAKFTEEDIRGEYDVEIKAGSTLPLDKETRMQAIEIVLNTLANVDTGNVSPLLNATITEFLDGFDIKALKEAYKQEQVLAAENARLAAQEGDANDAKAKSQAAKNVAQAEKVNTETDIMQDQAMGLLPPEKETAGVR